MTLKYSRAAIEDIDALVETRIMVLRAANMLSDAINMDHVKASSEDYYLKSLEDGSHVAYLVYDGDVIIGTGGASIFRVMPTYSNPSGIKAYVMNMYTSPEYRRKGIALKMLDLIVNELQKRGIEFISLEATAMGRPLYERYGFIKQEDEMVLPFTTAFDIMSVRGED